MTVGKKNGGLVYSTDGGRTCPGCPEFIAGCACDRKEPGEVSDGVVRVSSETKRRKGKCVTVIKGLASHPAA